MFSMLFWTPHSFVLVHQPPREWLHDSESRGNTITHEAPRPLPGRQPDERQIPPEQSPPLMPTEPPISPAIEDPKPDPITDQMNLCFY